jgi:hypothetical protein
LNHNSTTTKNEVSMIDCNANTRGTVPMTEVSEYSIGFEILCHRLVNELAGEQVFLKGWNMYV